MLRDPSSGATDDPHAQRGADPTTSRILTFAYGLGSSAIFVVTLLYAIGFLGNIVDTHVPRLRSDGARRHGAPHRPGLLTLFALQHSVMARRAFKRLLTKVVPRAAERSTYVLASSLALILLFSQWRPLWPVFARCKSLKPRLFESRAAIEQSVCDNRQLIARKSLILNGEMSERLKAHAWKAIRASHIDAPQSVSTHTRSVT